MLIGSYDSYLPYYRGRSGLSTRSLPICVILLLQAVSEESTNVYMRNNQR
jgi:hypothetical protein